MISRKARKICLYHEAWNWCQNVRRSLSGNILNTQTDQPFASWGPLYLEERDVHGTCINIRTRQLTLEDPSALLRISLMVVSSNRTDMPSCTAALTFFNSLLDEIGQRSVEWLKTRSIRFFLLIEKKSAFKISLETLWFIYSPWPYYYTHFVFVSCIKSSKIDNILIKIVHQK